MKREAGFYDDLRLAGNETLRRTAHPYATVLPYEGEIRSVEGLEARGVAPKEPPRPQRTCRPLGCGLLTESADR